MSRTFMISTLIYMMVQAVLFGIGAVLLLATPLAAHASTLFPWMVLVTFLISVPVSWILAPRLKARWEIRMPMDGV